MKRLLLIVLNLLVLQFSIIGQDTLNTITDSLYPRQKQKIRLLSYGTPALLLSYGFLSFENEPVKHLDQYISHELFEANSRISTHLDNQLRYLPLLAVYSLNAFGIKGKHDFFDRTAIYLVSNVIMSNAVDFLKDKTHKQRPSKTDFRAFPSGHTALAFGAAEFMRMEYKDLSPWYGYAAYSVAAATGAIRMMKNEHWLSDVLAGAGVGILSTKVSYMIYPWLKEKMAGKDLKIQTMPFIERGVTGYSMVIYLK